MKQEIKEKSQLNLIVFKFLRVRNLVVPTLYFFLPLILIEYDFTKLTIWIAFSSVISVNAFTFAINQIGDAEQDKATEQKIKTNPISQGRINLTIAKIILSILFLYGLISALVINLPFFVVAIIHLSIGYTYSIPPVRLKERPPIDLVVHGTFQGLLVVQAFNLKSFDIVLLVVLFSATSCRSFLAQLGNQIRDFDADKFAQTRTVGQIIGFRSLHYMFYLIAWIGISFFILWAILNAYWGLFLCQLLFIGLLTFFLLKWSTLKTFSAFSDFWWLFTWIILIFEMIIKN
ncbi:MAG: UbiA family prenyltransferase [Candidatus Hodarchaeales archaeon]|jgi:4-hydroxybenzoate polyprenyltransferase